MTLKGFPAGGKLLKVRNLGEYWIFYIAIPSKNRIIQYKVALDAKGKVVVRDQRVVDQEESLSNEIIGDERIV